MARRTRIPTERERFVIEQTRRGISFTETAAILGVTRERVRQIAKIHGLTAKDWRTTHNTRRELEKRHETARRMTVRRQETRLRQRAIREQLVEITRTLTQEYGEPPTMRQLEERSGRWVSDICRYFVGRMTGNWAQRGLRRLYRLAGTLPRSPGRPGWRTQ